ncbi:MAG: hypothetical protein RJA70_3352 [Pseudomonadota bacterium]
MTWGSVPARPPLQDLGIGTRAAFLDASLDSPAWSLGIFLWAEPGLNRRHPACKAGALPTELSAREKAAHKRHPRGAAVVTGGSMKRKTKRTPGDSRNDQMAFALQSAQECYKRRDFRVFQPVLG